MPDWMKTWAFYVAYALDLLANALIAGSPCETISSRCYRLDHIPIYRCLEIIINAIARPFDGPNHCQQSYENIKAGAYLPWGFYEKAQEQALEMNAEFEAA
jgi:hypothetical protein